MRWLAVMLIGAMPFGAVGGLAPCGTDPIVNGEVMFRLEPGTDLQTFLDAFGIVGDALRAVPSRDVYLYPIPGVQDAELFAGQLDSDPRTRWAEPNYFSDAPEGSARSFFFSERDVPGDYISQGAWDQIGVSDGHAVQANANGIVVAVLDTGLDVSHPALDGIVAPGGWNFIDQNANIADAFAGQDADGDGDTDELVGHGTHVAGIVAYVAPGAQILPIKALDSEGNSDNFVLGEALFYAIDQGVDLINLSAGSTYDSKIVEDAVEEAVANGIVVVASAGNLGDAANEPEYPAMYEDTLGVGAVDLDDVRADFSNYSTFDCENDPVLLSLVAPGEAIFSTIPADTGYLYAAWDGTSMATPLVSGTVALMLARHPGWIPNRTRVAQVFSHLRASAVSIDDLPGNIGTPWEGNLGAGRLDVEAALTIPIAFDNVPPTAVASSPTAVVAADLNGDHRVDLAIAREDNNCVALLFNDGAGAFGQQTNYFVGAAPVAIVAADFNGDGAPDLMTANNDTTSVSVLINDGVGGFSVTGNPFVGPGPAWLAVGDFNHDLAVDVVVVLEDGNSAVILANDGRGNFAARTSVPVGIKPEGVAVADLNGDQRPDFVTSNRDDNSISVVLATGPYTFATSVAHPTPPDPRSVALLDFDHDGDFDISVGTQDTSTVRLLANNGSGGFSVLVDIPMGFELQPERLATADLNCDGRQDLIVANSFEMGDEQLDGTLSVLITEGGGAFMGPFEHPVGREPTSIGVGDLDGDGDADVLTTDRTSNQLSFLRNQTCAARLPGDLNCDGAITVGDINPFVLALTDAPGYSAAFPNCDADNGDCNRDGQLSVGDINCFVELVTGG